MKTICKGFIVINIISIFTILLCKSGYCQKKFTRKQIVSFINERWDLRTIRSEYPKSGTEIIKVIKKCWPNEIDTMLIMGAKKMEDEDWRSSIPWFEMVLTNDPDNLLAHYRLGICQRELGRASLLESIGLWPAAEKHFRYVIKVCPTFKDVLYQYSQLESFRRHGARAIELFDSQIKNGGFNDQTEGYLITLYDRFIHQESFKKAEAFLKSRPNAWNKFYLAELYRINNEYGKADSIYQILRSDYDSIPPTLFYLSLTRFYVQTDQPEKADEVYWQAVEYMSGDLEKKLLLNDFMFIIKKKEYDLLKKDLSFDLLKEAYQRFWLDRDPMPAAPYNYRLIEHYRRLIYAEQHFRYHDLQDKKSQHKLPIQPAYLTYPLPEKIFYPEWYDLNDKFNDKALIYIRFGEPDETSFIYPTPAIAQSEDNSSDLVKNITWLYYETGNRPRLIFHFIGLGKNSWKLTLSFAQKEIEGELVREFGPLRIDDRKENMKYAFQNDLHSWPKGTEDLGMVYSLAHFKKSKDEEIVQLSYAIPLSNIIYEETASDSVSLETGIAVFNEKMNLQFKDVRYFNLQNKNEPHVWQNLFIDEFEFPMKLSRHNIALHARVIGQNKISGYKFHYTLADFFRDKLFCSSIKLAYHISAKKILENRYRNNLNIVPNPTKRFKSDEPLFAYFEIYNVSKNSAGKTNYSIHFEITQITKKQNVFKKVLSLFGGQEKYRVSIKNDYEGDSSIIFDYMRFDMSSLNKGEYELKMIVRDNVSGTEAVSGTDFVLN